MSATRMLTANTTAEWDAIAHLRGWCHNMLACPICAAEQAGYARGRDAAITEIAEGTRVHP